MLKGITERVTTNKEGTANSDSTDRGTAGSPEEQLRALKSVETMLAELRKAGWSPSLFIDAVVKPEEQRQLLRKHAERMMKVDDPHVVVDDRMRMRRTVINATSAAAGQMMGWHSTLQWLDAKAPNTDLLVLRIDLVLKPPLGLYHRPSCLVFPFQGHMFNATDAFVYVPHSERASFMTELMVEVPLSEDEIGLHCLLGRYPNAAPLLPDPYDANSEEGRNPLYRIAGRQEAGEEEPTRKYASWLLVNEE